MVVVDCRSVSVRRGDRLLLADVDLQVRAGENWVVFGPNGAGKTTLLTIVAGRMFPTTGTVIVLDDELGAVDLSDLRPRIGWASAALNTDIPARESALDVVLTGAHAITGRWREEYDTVDHVRARALLALWGLESLERRTFGTLSEGERKRSLIARALMADPELLLLDEPGAGLDLGGREALLTGLDMLASDPASPTVIMVTHHVEDIPSTFTHALLLADGRVRASGPIDQVITSANLSDAYGMPLQVQQIAGRRFAMASRP